MDDWPLVGRETLVAEAAARVGDGGSLALLGPSGVGKTALAGAVADRFALAADRPVVWLRPVAELRTLPLGSVALLLGTGQLSVPDAAAALADRVADGLLVVDDAHDLDDASAGLLHQLVVARRFPVVLTVTDGRTPPEAVTRLWKDRIAERVEVPALDHAGVGRLLSAALGGPVDPALVDEIDRRTLGSPLFVRELVTAAVADGSVANPAGRWTAVRPLDVPPRLADLVAARLAGLPPDVRAVLDLVAVVDAVPLDLLEEIAPPGALAQLERAGLIVVDATLPPTVRGGHPFVTRTAAALVAVSARRAMLRDLAQRFSARATGPVDRARLLRWQLDAGIVLRGDELVAGAGDALAAGDLVLALRASEAGFSIDPSFASGLLRARVLLRAEDHAPALAALTQIEALATTPEEVIALTQTRAQVLAYGQGKSGEAAAALAGAGVGGDDRVAHIEGALLLYQGRPAEALTRIARLAGADDDARVYGAVVEAIALLLVGRLDACLARCDDLDRTIDAARRTDAVGDHRMAEVIRLLAGVERGTPVAVAAAGEQRWAVWSATPGAGQWAHWLAWVTGRAALLRGRAAEAAMWFRRSETATGTLPAMLDGWVGGSRAYAELLAGDEGAAAALAARDDADGSQPGDDGIDRARAWWLARRGRRADAFDVLAARADALAEQQVHIFEVSLRHDVVRLGRADRALVGRLGELAALIDGELVGARLAHAEALTSGDPARLGAVAERFADLGADLFAAEAAAQGATVARRRGDRVAGALAAYAEQCRARCGTELSPAFDDDTSAPGPVRLTARERDIAARAATGVPSKAIAAELGISRRTVDNTLQRVFVKLGVVSRADLLDRLG